MNRKIIYKILEIAGCIISLISYILIHVIVTEKIIVYKLLFCLIGLGAFLLVPNMYINYKERKQNGDNRSIVSNSRWKIVVIIGILSFFVALVVIK